MLYLSFVVSEHVAGLSLRLLREKHSVQKETGHTYVCREGCGWKGRKRGSGMVKDLWSLSVQETDLVRKATSSHSQAPNITRRHSSSRSHKSQNLTANHLFAAVTPQASSPTSLVFSQTQREEASAALTTNR